MSSTKQDKKIMEISLVGSGAVGFDGLANLLRHAANLVESGQMTLNSGRKEDVRFRAEVFEISDELAKATNSVGEEVTVDLYEIAESANEKDLRPARSYAMNLLRMASVQDGRRLVVVRDKAAGKTISGFVPKGEDMNTIAVALGIDEDHADELVIFDVLSNLHF